MNPVNAWQFMTYCGRHQGAVCCTPEFNHTYLRAHQCGKKRIDNFILSIVACRRLTRVKMRIVANRHLYLHAHTRTPMGKIIQPFAFNLDLMMCAGHNVVLCRPEAIPTTPAGHLMSLPTLFFFLPARLFFHYYNSAGRQSIPTDYITN